MLNLNYPKNKIKIVEINDGSTDKTGEILKKFRGIKVIEKKNEGSKAKALNYALRRIKIKTDLLACMDADSYPDRNFLLNMIGFFEDKKIAAVTPAMKVLKPKTIMERVQWMEYLFSIFLRKLFSIFECQYVLPGPGSIYRSWIFKKIGYFDEDNITEDMEIAFRMNDKGYKIENSSTAYVYTDCPKNFSGLFKQRLRWYRGYLSNVMKYSHMILNPKHGNLGMFLLPINFVWTVIIAFFFIYPIFGWLNGAISGFFTWKAINFSILKPEFDTSIVYADFYTTFLFIFWSLNIMTIYYSLKVSGEKVNIKKRIINYISFMFIYPLILSIFWISAVAAELLGVRKKWHGK